MPGQGTAEMPANEWASEARDTFLAAIDHTPPAPARGPRKQPEPHPFADRQPRDDRRKAARAVPVVPDGGRPALPAGNRHLPQQIAQLSLAEVLRRHVLGGDEPPLRVEERRHHALAGDGETKVVEDRPPCDDQGRHIERRGDVRPAAGPADESVGSRDQRPLFGLKT